MKGESHSSDIEKKWQKAWSDARLYEIDIEKAKDPYYLLFEFPYPSGNLHTGHWYAYAMPDIYARYLRMTGKDVFFPVGFDSFGLPAENAAIKNNVSPKDWTYENMRTMEDQLRLMGASFDWNRKVVTSEPSYYGWTQWIFTKLFEQGLAYRKEAVTNWCPSCKTVLSNEQVTGGTCERCGNEVEQKMMNQWFLRITDYADKLLAALDELQWPEEIKQSQRAWIGKSEGAQIPFVIKGDGHEASLEVFTTRADTLFGVTFLVISPEKAKEWMGEWYHAPDAVRTYVEESLTKKERERLIDVREKTGEDTTLTAIHPLTKEAIPVYVADYVLGSYGTGAVMAVPAHDERDREFALKYNLPIVPVVDDNGVLIDSGEYTGMVASESKIKIAEHAGGVKTETYRLRDWSVGRQRYWGCPIPIVYDPEGNPHVVTQDHLPWTLPTDVDFTPDGTAPLARSQELKDRVTSIFGEGWTPDVETLDTFVDSSWYFLRYLAPENTDVFAPSDLLKKWIPVNRYSGGSEHTTMHVLYARFMMRALYEMALVPTPEPFLERMNRGLIMGPDGAKMSKSKGNVVNPDEYVKKYGADTVRTYLSFIGPYNEVGHYPWNPDSIYGIKKFLDRVSKLIKKVSKDAVPDTTLSKNLNDAVVRATRDIPQYKFHTALAGMMTLMNVLEERETIPTSVYETLLKLLAPYAPHLTEELWHDLGHESFIHSETWPESIDLPEEEEVSIIVQIDGKMRGHVSVSKTATQEEVETKAYELPKVQEAKEKGIEKIVYVSGRVINIVTRKV